MTVIYRDKMTHARILIPVDKQRHIGSGGLRDLEGWYIECVEISDFLGRGYMNARKFFMSTVILERYYKKEEL